MNSYQSSIRKVFMKRGTRTEKAVGDENADWVEHHDPRIAACALFLEMAQIDDEFSERERGMILNILREEYGVSEEFAAALAEQAEKERKNSLDLWHFTELINQNFSKEEKIRVVELLWRIIYADGKLSGHEDYLVHSLAKMLCLSHKELIDAKLGEIYDDEE